MCESYELHKKDWDSSWKRVPCFSHLSAGSDSSSGGVLTAEETVHLGAGWMQVGSWLVLGKSSTRFRGRPSSMYVQANCERMPLSLTCKNKDKKQGTKIRQPRDEIEILRPSQRTGCFWNLEGLREMLIQHCCACLIHACLGLAGLQSLLSQRPSIKEK